MFFNLPGVALRNIRRALKPGGELTYVRRRRRREDNSWIDDAEMVVKDIEPVVSMFTTLIRCIAGPDRLRWPAPIW